MESEMVNKDLGIIGASVIFVVVYLGGFAAVVYVAWHFITKFW